MKFKRAVWDCGGDRAPGPDGFTFNFFITFWDIIEKDVVRFVQEFSTTHEIPKGCNPYFIALIPKVSNAKFVYDFSILVSNRMSTTKSSPAILANRFVMLLVICVDFEKAFDSVRWDYLDAVMEKIGFGIKWRSWILGCLKNARSSILVNGSPTKEFELFKGLSDKNEISYSLPFFFMLRAMEGLKINIDKSSVLGVGVSVEENAHMVRTIGFGVSNLPFKYLGIPVGCNMSRCVHWNAVIQSFTSKLSSWKARLLLRWGVKYSG
ncbi:RNA-directed DNA polymerase, eukaryota, reverse transcriptase zinc-binding domain protein [Tanacetum coccineum]